MIQTKNNFLFVEIQSNELIDKGLINELLDEKITGILFKNFLSSNEVLSIKNNVSKIPLSKKTIINEGFSTYPISFAQFSQMMENNLMTIEDYIKIAEDLIQNQTIDLGVNITQKLIDFLINNNLFQNIGPIIEPTSSKPLVPFNIRELFPGNGELVVHCENLFFKEFPNFFNWLKIMDIKDNKLSYFITIQKPNEGGELCCYDLHWDDVNNRDTHTILKGKSGELYNINSNDISKFLINPDEGD
ncbi:MAG: hypothetical protein EBQ94_13735, partial [Flavobacteriales bacterium]|nr:hypothetical protein [Flavobacteriales bacterium]